MTEFVPRARIERMASEHWRHHNLAPGFDIERLVDLLDLGILWHDIEPNEGHVVAAELSPVEGLIRINESLRSLIEKNAGFYRFTVAHEIGHWELHCGGVRTPSVSIFEDAEIVMCRSLSFGRDTDASLSQHEARREHQANLFATYLLAPHDIFIAGLRTTGCNGWQALFKLAELLGLSPSATLVRLAEEGLGHKDDRGVPRNGKKPSPGQVNLGI